MTRKTKAKKVVKTTRKKNATDKPKWRHATLDAELAAIGLRIEAMSPDGNCFFRAVADQLHGDASRHPEIRRQVVQHMRDNEDSYAPFVEFDEAFETYAERMARDATWAGNIEVQAASVCFGCNVHIYQQGQACWRTVNFTPPEHQPCLHLSYHDGDHYNSVRLQSDAGGGPPEHIDLTACHVAPEGVYGEKDVAQVSQNTLCFDVDRVHAALQACSGDVDAAVEWLIEALGRDPASDSAADVGALQAADVLQAGASPDAAGMCGLSADHPTGEGAPCPGREASPASSRSGKTAGVCKPVPLPASSESPKEAERPVGDAAAGLHAHPIETGTAYSAGADSASIAGGATAGGSTSQWPSGEASADGDQADGSPRATRRASDGNAVGKPTDSPECATANDAPRVVGKAARRREAAAKRPAKNKLCPCGSHRKYKNCCKASDERRLRAAAAEGAPGRGAGLEASAAARLAGLHLQMLDI